MAVRWNGSSGRSLGAACPRRAAKIGAEIKVRLAPSTVPLAASSARGQLRAPWGAASYWSQWVIFDVSPAVGPSLKGRGAWKRRAPCRADDRACAGGCRGTSYRLCAALSHAVPLAKPDSMAQIVRSIPRHRRRAHSAISTRPACHPHPLVTRSHRVVLCPTETDHVICAYHLTGFALSSATEAQ